jgi:hypothetical protein
MLTQAPGQRPGHIAVRSRGGTTTVLRTAVVAEARPAEALSTTTAEETLTKKFVREEPRLAAAILSLTAMERVRTQRTLDFAGSNRGPGVGDIIDLGRTVLPDAIEAYDLRTTNADAKRTDGKRTPLLAPQVEAWQHTPPTSANFSQREFRTLTRLNATSRLVEAGCQIVRPDIDLAANGVVSVIQSMGAFHASPSPQLQLPGIA